MADEMDYGLEAGKVFLTEDELEKIDRDPDAFDEDYILSRARRESGVYNLAYVELDAEAQLIRYDFWRTPENMRRYVG